MPLKTNSEVKMYVKSVTAFCNSVCNFLYPIGLTANTEYVDSSDMKQHSFIFIR